MWEQYCMRERLRQHVTFSALFSFCVSAHFWVTRCEGVSLLSDSVELGGTYRRFLFDKLGYNDSIQISENNPQTLL